MINITHCFDHDNGNEGDNTYEQLMQSESNWEKLSENKFMPSIYVQGCEMKFENKFIYPCTKSYNTHSRNEINLDILFPHQVHRHFIENHICFSTLGPHWLSFHFLFSI